MHIDEITSHDWNPGEERVEVDRKDVLVRLVYSIVFAAIVGLLDTLMALIVVFQLLFSLITETLPSKRLQRFANSLIAYYYQVLRYVSHNDSVIPFPFSDLPAPLEATRPAYAVSDDDDPQGRDRD